MAAPCVKYNTSRLEAEGHMPALTSYLWTGHLSRSHSHCCHLRAQRRQGRVHGLGDILCLCLKKYAARIPCGRLENKYVLMLPADRGKPRRTSQRRCLHVGHGQLLQALLASFSAVNGVDSLYKLPTWQTYNGLKTTNKLKAFLHREHLKAYACIFNNEVNVTTLAMLISEHVAFSWSSYQPMFGTVMYLSCLVLSDLIDYNSYFVGGLRVKQTLAIMFLLSRFIF